MHVSGVKEGAQDRDEGWEATELGLHRQAGLLQAQKGVDNLAREEPAWQQDTLARAWAFLGQASAVSLTLWRNELGGRPECGKAERASIWMCQDTLGRRLCGVGRGAAGEVGGAVERSPILQGTHPSHPFHPETAVHNQGSCYGWDPKVLKILKLSLTSCGPPKRWELVEVRSN